MVDLVTIQNLKMVPFFISVLLYFVFVQDPHGEIWTTFLKCLPILCLIVYVLLEKAVATKNSRTVHYVLAGLVFSCAGDALLNIDLFPHGMAAFAVTQIFYISAFGWRPLMLAAAVPLYLAGVIMVIVLFPNLDLVLSIGLPIYSFLLVTMCWRSTAKGIHKKDFLNVFCALGSVLFVMSDGMIAFNMFYTTIPHARIWIMATYYLAQFAIVFSTVHERKFALKDH